MATRAQQLLDTILALKEAQSHEGWDDDDQAVIRRTMERLLGAYEQECNADKYEKRFEALKTLMRLVPVKQTPFSAVAELGRALVQRQMDMRDRLPASALAAVTQRINSPGGQEPQQVTPPPSCPAPATEVHSSEQQQPQPHLQHPSSAVAASEGLRVGDDGGEGGWGPAPPFDAAANGFGGASPPDARTFGGLTSKDVSPSVRQAVDTSLVQASLVRGPPCTGQFPVSTGQATTLVSDCRGFPAAPHAVPQGMGVPAAYLRPTGDGSPAPLQEAMASIVQHTPPEKLREMLAGGSVPSRSLSQGSEGSEPPSDPRRQPGGAPATTLVPRGFALGGGGGDSVAQFASLESLQTEGDDDDAPRLPAGAGAPAGASTS